MPLRPRFRPPVWLVVVGLIVGSLLLGLLAGFAGELLRGPGALARTAGFGLLALILAAALALGCWWWRSIDEAAREAHKWAWWWGGSSGMAVGMGVLVFLAHGGGAPLITAGSGAAPADVMAAGILLIVGLQLVGYALAWAFWWWRRR